jgi:probable rRNA maturation factor
MSIEITDLQDFKKINIKKISGYLKKAVLFLGLSSKKITFCLCDNEFIINLNKKYFKKSTPTDVIAFPLSDTIDGDYLGEVVVSVEAAVKAAEAARLDWHDELLLYLVHGVLHLAGYDDTAAVKRKKMRAKERETLAHIGCRQDELL